MIENRDHSAIDTFAHNVKFLRSWLKKPKTIGSIWPTSAYMARRMASVIDISSGLPVLEIGPGVGTITKAILEAGLAPGKLYAVEYTEEFIVRLHTSFPTIKLIHGDAYALEQTLGTDNKTEFDCVISSLPLLNVSMKTRIAYVEDALKRIPMGRPLIQFSYGAFAPVPEKLGSFTVERYDFVLQNIPPAQLWIYRRTKQ